MVGSRSNKSRGKEKRLKCLFACLCMSDSYYDETENCYLLKLGNLPIQDFENYSGVISLRIDSDCIYICDFTVNINQTHVFTQIKITYHILT